MMRWFKKIDSHIWVGIIYFLVGIIAGCNVTAYKKGEALKEELREKQSIMMELPDDYIDTDWEPTKLKPRSRW